MPVQGYLLKDAESEELLSAIRAVHQGQKHIPPRVGAKLLERMASPLSDRGLEVLQLITTGNSTQAIWRNSPTNQGGPTTGQWLVFRLSSLS